ncbi:MAG: ATP-binding cassette domain-containing protein [Dehalococcoidia bacterium]|nr:ATP-binding cassette domain-containing protein [Dehalococcoidia bacterium]
MEFIIDVSGLKKSFGKHEVLRGVDFNVKTGQVFSLLGSNGAGKTTIVRILSTLARLDDGKVTICGYDLIANPSSVRGCISLTGQYAAVDEMLTGRENMHLVAKLRHLRDYKDRVDELLAMFGLSDAANTLVKKYSGGMRRKVDIAMSLLGEPQIIFLDEPTTGLDPQSRLSLWKTIGELKSKGTTIFLTTQYLEEAERLSDIVAVLDNGKVVACGTPNELKTALKELGNQEYESEMPTLEDVFLSIVNKKGGSDTK